MEPTSKARYRAGKGRIRVLSPIRESSGIIPVHVIPRGTKMIKGAGGHAPILVQALPPEVAHPKPKMKPSERHYTAVDQVVADYLHYARYGQVMPVLYGDNTGVGASGRGLSCACCVDRNRESTMKKIALQRGEDPSAVQPLTPPKDAPEDHTTPSSSLPDMSPRYSYNQSPSPRRIPASHLSPRHAQDNWMYYQPTAPAGTFLNPEFNRPFVMQTAIEDAAVKDAAQTAYINRRVLEANSKYDHNMRKLQVHFENDFVLPDGPIYRGEDKEDTFS